MSVNHHDLRSAFGRFLAAKRALRQDYRESRASHGPGESIPHLESAAAYESGDDSLMIEELEELRGENQMLRKSLALLHTYSLRVQEQHVNLVAQRDKLLEVSEAVASQMRDDGRADNNAMIVLEQLENVIGELSSNTHAYA